MTLESAAAARLRLRVWCNACGRQIELDPADGVVVRIPWFCTGVADPLRYRSTVLTDVSPDARQVVLIGAGPEAAQDLLDASRTETVLTTAPRAANTGWLPQ
jgi:hypothetical protein